MKIRHPGLIKMMSLGGSGLLRCLLETVTFHYRPLGPNIDPFQHRGLNRRYIYSMWHEYLILGCRYARPDMHILISQHADGDLIAQTCRHLGFNVVRGSTTRGGAEALWQMVKLGETDHLGITPDGPRGPRRKVQTGVVYLASQTGLPIIPLGIAYQRPWRLRSWDRFALPKPGSLTVGISDQPIVVPANASRDVLEKYRLLVESEMHRLCGIADEWVETGVWPGSRRPLPAPSWEDAKQAVA